MKQKLKQILSRVFIGLTIFLIVMLTYKSSNPYAYPGIETRVLFILVPMGVVLLYLHLCEEETYSRLSSRIIAVVGEVHYSRYMRFCQIRWQMIPSLIRITVSKGLARVYTRLNKFYLYLLNKDLKNLVSYAFIGLLLILAVQSIAPEPLKGWERTPLMVTAVALGAITFYLNRDKLEDIEEEARQEEIEEKRRDMEFAGKFPRTNRVWGVRRIVRRMYKEGWGYSVGLILILLVANGFYFYGLGNYNMRDDEIIVNSVAYNYVKEGNFYQWDWISDTSGKNTDCNNKAYCYYDRAWPYTLTVAASYKIFGITEFSTRLPGVLFGIIGIIIIYFISKFFIGNKSISLLTSFLFTFSPIMITWFRFARMYSLLIPLFLLTAYFMYRAITEKNNYKVKNHFANKILHYLNFNYTFAILAAIFLWISFKIHIGTLIILPFLFIFTLLKLLITRENRYLYMFLLIIITSLIGIFAFNSIFNNIIQQLIILGEIGNRILYEVYLLNYPLTTSLSLLFIAIIGTFAAINYKQKISSKILYLIIFVIGSLLMYTRYIGTGLFIDSRYISFLIPFVFIIISFSFFIIIKTINKKIFSLFMVMLLIVLAVNSFIIFSEKYYDFSRHPKLRESYSTILENYKPGELIVSNSLREYYLRGINATHFYIMPWRRGASFEDFVNTISSYNSGWVVWEVDKVSTHIRPEIYRYAEKNFIKYHGTGIDDTKVDVYYFNQSMISNSVK